MGTLTFIGNKGRYFRIKSHIGQIAHPEEYPDYWDHIGEVFLADSVEYCKWQGNGFDRLCGRCPGGVRAPWQSRVACWGLYGELKLEEVISKDS